MAKEGKPDAAGDESDGTAGDVRDCRGEKEDKPTSQKTGSSSGKQAGIKERKRSRHPEPGSVTFSAPTRKRRRLPSDWPHASLGRSYLAASQVWDMEGRLRLDKRQSHFPGTPLTKDSGGTLNPGQWRHIRTTYAFAQLVFDEDTMLGECFRIPLGYIHQLLLHDQADSTGEVANPTLSHAEMEDARADADVLPTFPGTPLEDRSRPLNSEQLNHVEETYKGLFVDMDSLSREAYGGPGIGVEDYCYVLGLLEQLIHHIRGSEAKGEL